MATEAGKADLSSRVADVLVVDDDADACDLLAELLSGAGHRVRRALDGEQALKEIAQSPPDLMLLDLLLPDVAGVEVLRRVRASDATKHMAVIVVTGVSEIDRRVGAFEAGADDVVLKPVHEKELIARVRTILHAKAYERMLRLHEHDLETQVTQRTEELQSARERLQGSALELVFTLTHVAEYRDEDTAGHIQRMAHTSEVVARRLGMPGQDAEMLLYASAMHDIGKVGIPDSILLKPGKLDPREWEAMKAHTTIGAQILSHSEVPMINLAEEVAFSHHEKWDGSGYPQGLKGEAIPLVGRITAVADVFDALTSRRPYKEPYTVVESLEIVRAARGYHFDPRVVDAFMASQDDVKAIRHRFGDMSDTQLFRQVRPSA